MFKTLMFAGGSRAVVAVAMVAMFGAGAALASAQPGPGRGRGGPGGPDGAFGRGFAMGVSELRGLDLSETQREQVRTIMQTHRDDARAVQQRQQAAMRTLQEATRGTDEAAIRQHGEAVGAAIADAAVLRSKVRNEVWAVLTPEQQAKAEELRAQRQARQQERQTRMQQRMQERQKQRGAERPQA